jgi:RES domain-containing protein
LRLYRVTRLRAVAAEAIDGYSAARSPGRWNERGHRAVYLSTRVSLGLLEIVVQAGTASLDGYAYYPVDVPDAQLVRLDRTRLSARWRMMAGRTECRALAAAWRGTSVGLIVPSAVLPEAYDEGEFNVVLDPGHTGFAAIVLGAPVALHPDPRLVALIARRP